MVDRNFRLLREATLALGVVYDAVAVGDGQTRFVNSVSMDPMKIGYTVHRIDGDSVVSSFGEPNDSTYSPASAPCSDSWRCIRVGISSVTEHRKPATAEHLKSGHGT